MIYLVCINRLSDKKYEVLSCEEFNGEYDMDDGFFKLLGYTPYTIHGNDDFLLVDLDFVVQTKETDMITAEKRIIDVRKQMRRLININKLL